MKNYRFKKFQDNLGNKYLYRFHEAILVKSDNTVEGVMSWFDDVEDLKHHILDPLFYNHTNNVVPTSIEEDKNIKIDPKWIEEYVAHSDVVKYNLDNQHGK